MDLKGKNVYISGPITGKLLHNAPAFAEAHAMLKEMGVRQIGDPSFLWLTDRSDTGTHEDYMRMTLHDLTTSNRGEPYYSAIVMLDGYEGSEGARLELEVAEAIGLEVIKMGDLRNLWSNQEEG
jgi:hypothetical protein